jgi:glutamine amidotransferase
MAWQMSDRVVVIDYGVGNVGSVLNILKRIGADAIVSGREADIASADRLILPGIGAFDNGMRRLKATGLVPQLHQRVVDEGVPLLGICLGMQLLMHGSEEGEEPGLGWIDGDVVRFQFPDEAPGLRVPFIGWSTIEQCRPTQALDGIPVDAEFYFVHSFHVRCSPEVVAARTDYGYPFASAIEKDNIVGVQFHPEKSQRAGMAVLRNFIQRF